MYTLIVVICFSGQPCSYINTHRYFDYYEDCRDAADAEMSRPGVARAFCSAR